MKGESVQRRKMRMLMIAILGIIAVIGTSLAMMQYFIYNNFNAMTIGLYIFVPCWGIILYLCIYGLPLSRSYHMELDFQEIYTLFFKKKVCPYCKCKMKRIQRTSFEGEKFLELGHYFSYGKQYNMKIYYECDSCHKKMTLKELAKLNKSNRL